MIICKKAPRFDAITGKQIERKVAHEIRCDYTGVVINHDDDYCRYILNYRDNDPCFGSAGKEVDFGEKYDIDMHEFLGQEYQFLSVGGSNNPNDYSEIAMMNEAIKNYNNNDSEFYRCFTFDAICRASRVKIAQILIDEGEVTPDQLIED